MIEIEDEIKNEIDESLHPRDTISTKSMDEVSGGAANQSHQKVQNDQQLRSDQERSE